MEESTHEAQEEVEAHQKWYMRPKWLAALAALIAALSFAAFTTTTVVTSSRTEETSSNVDDLEGAIKAIQKNQDGIDELVAFVRYFEGRMCKNDPTLEFCEENGEP